MAITRYALTNGGNIVQNVVLWDGGPQWSVPVGLTARLLNGRSVNIGDTYDGTTVTPAATTPTQLAAANRLSLLEKAVTALTGNITFLAISSPTNPQVLAQVQALTKQVDAIIKVVAQQLADTSGT